MNIRKTAVIGAGTMGSGIAAHMANAGAQVVLLDIVPEDADDRSVLAKQALEKMKRSGRALTHPDHAERITPGNLEDDLDTLRDTDWIVEAVVEDPDVKRDLYDRLDDVRKDGSVVSSNTSTLPLQQLKERLSGALKDDLCITHFFNPPRQMPLLELVTDARNDNARLDALRGFIDRAMGKTIVEAKDTPGFIANRIGMFWLMCGLEEAIAKDIPIELADALFGKALGFPKTGIFGLMDLIGLDLMLDITRSLRERLPQDDPYQRLDASLRLLDTMVKQERTGLKGGGGFYRKDKDGKQALDLSGGDYREAKQPEDAALKAASCDGLQAALETDSPGGAYAWAVLSRMLAYGLSLVPEIADDPLSVDTALQLGLNWQRGPFAMVDAMGNGHNEGAVWFQQALKEAGYGIPPLLAQAAEQNGFYREKDSSRAYLGTDGSYHTIGVPGDRWQLADKVRGTAPALENDAGKLWDVGDGIACVQLTTKMDTMDHATFDLFEQAISTVKRDFKGLIIGDDDTHFSAGLNLKRMLSWCEAKDWDAIESILRRGQDTWMALKYAPFPVVGAPSGKALGGACELLLHCDGIQAHIDSQIGLVEVNIGVVPAWGGCKEMLLRSLAGLSDPASQVQAAETVFERIANARPAPSAEIARDWHILRDCCGISMNRERLLADAKALCLQKAAGYEPPQAPSAALPRGAARKVMEQAIDSRAAGNGSGNGLSAHDRHVLRALAIVLSGGNGMPDIMKQLDLAVVEDFGNDDGAPSPLTENALLELERRAFMALIQSHITQDKIRRIL